LAPGYIVPSPGITFKGLLTICYGVKAIADDDRAFASGEKDDVHRHESVSCEERR
jgi:hypothetical protein